MSTCYSDAAIHHFDRLSDKANTELPSHIGQRQGAELDFMFHTHDRAA
jgi:hypothetical protein